MHVAATRARGRARMLHRCGDLIRDLDARASLAGEAGARPPGALGAHLRARGPDAVAVGRRAAADDRAAARRRRRASASTSRGWPTTGSPGSGFGTGFAHETVPDGAASRRPSEHGFPLFEVPYEVPFIAVTEKAFTHLVNEQYAVLQRALSAHERLERIVLSERGLDGVAGALASLIGGPALIFDAPRRGARAARVRARAARRAVAALAAELRERARARARAAASRPARRSSPAARSRCRCARTPRAATATARRRRRGSWRPRTPGALTEFDRLTLHQAVTIVALELLRRRVADDTERRLAGDVLDRDGVRRARRAPSSRAGSSRSGCASAPACSCSRRRGRSRAAAEEALARAVREEAPGGLVAGTGRFSCALLPPPRRGGDDELFALAERAARARRARVGASRSPAGAGRAVAAGRPAARVPRGALRARGARRSAPTATATAPALATYRDLGSFQLLLVAAGRRRAAAVLRLDPRADRGGRGRLRRRADALAGGVHRVQRPVGAGRAPALLPPSHAALPDPPRRGADRPLAGLRARPDRLLARPARARADPASDERNDQ